MKIEVRQTKENGITQITTLGSRWYTKEAPDGTLQFNPSVTWITHYAPMGIGLLKFFAEHGWDEAEEIKNVAGERGTNVHFGVERLLLGGTVKMDDEMNLSPEEYWGLMTFSDFWADLNREHKVEIVDTERVCWVDALPGKKYGYAGTRDLKLIVDGRPTIIDFKTSKDVYLSHELQLSALKHADPDLPDIAVLQVGYARNKRGWKLTAIEDKFPLFQACQMFWEDDNPDTKPRQKDFPAEIVLKKPEECVAAAPAGPDPRIELYKKEVLTKGEMQPTKDLSITAKWNKYLRSQFPLRKTSKDVTVSEWDSLLTKLDGIRAIQGDKGVVLHIEQTLAKENQ